METVSPFFFPEAVWLNENREDGEDLNRLRLLLGLVILGCFGFAEIRLFRPKLVVLEGSSCGGDGGGSF